MASQRKTIREKVVELLKSRTMAGERVFAARVLPIQSLEEIPCLMVYTSDEKSEPSGDRLFLDRTCTLTIEGAVKGNEDEIDALADELADQVEAVVDADPRLGGLVSVDLSLKSTFLEVGVQGHDVIAGFRMDYEAVYMTRRVVDEFPAITPPPTKVWTVPSTTTEGLEEFLGTNPPPTPQSEAACGPDGCDLPFYQGELQP